RVVPAQLPARRLCLAGGVQQGDALGGAGPVEQFAAPQQGAPAAAVQSVQIAQPPVDQGVGRPLLRPGLVPVLLRCSMRPAGQASTASTLWFFCIHFTSLVAKIWSSICYTNQTRSLLQPAGGIHPDFTSCRQDAKKPRRFIPSRLSALHMELLSRFELETSS